MNTKSLFKLSLILLVGLFLFVFAGNIIAQENKVLLKSQNAPEIIPLYDLDCSNFDSIDSCYKNFLNQGKDESICGKFSEEEKNWTTQDFLESKTRGCFRGFAVAKEDYKVCDNIKSGYCGNELVNRQLCYIEVAIASNNLRPCVLLSDGDKNSCFDKFGPILNSTWIEWFLPKVLGYVFVTIIVYVISLLFLSKTNYKKKLSIFSAATIIFQIILLALILSSPKKLKTNDLSMLILIPAIFLFLSAFVIKGWDILLNKAAAKWIIASYSMIAGFINGFISFFLGTLIAYKFVIDLGIVGVFYYALMNAVIFAVVYLLFYFWVIKYIQKRIV